MQEKRDLYHLYDALDSIIETADQNQDDIQKAIELMNQETEKLGKMTNEVRNLLHQEIKKSISSITDRVEADVVAKLGEVNKQAEVATSKYKMVSFLIPIKFFVFLTIGGVCILTLATMIMLKILPTASEIENRFETIKK